MVETNPLTFRNSEKIHLFSLQKAKIPSPNRKTFTQNPGNLILCNKVLSEMDIKLKGEFKKRLKNRNSNENGSNLGIMQSERKNVIQRKSWHISSDRGHSKGKTISDINILKKLLNL